MDEIRVKQYVQVGHVEAVHLDGGQVKGGPNVTHLQTVVIIS